MAAIALGASGPLEISECLLPQPDNCINHVVGYTLSARK